MQGEIQSSQQLKCISLALKRLYRQNALCSARKNSVIEFPPKHSSSASSGVVLFVELVSAAAGNED